MSWSLKWGEGRGGSVGRAGGGLRWPVRPLGGVVCRDHAEDPAFAPGTSEMAVGSWPFCILLFLIAPTAHALQLFLAPCSFFVFCCCGDVCSGVSNAAKGLGVPACLSPVDTQRDPFRTSDLQSCKIINVGCLKGLRNERSGHWLFFLS